MTSELEEYRKQLAVEYDQLHDATEEALDAWDKTNSEGNLQFPKLLTTLAVKFNWDEKAIRENDPLVRKYIRKHPKWYVTRGAHGGIMRRAEWDKKNAAKAEKEAIKEQMRAAIEAKQAAAKSDSTPVDSE